MGTTLRSLFDQLSTNWQCKVLSSYNHARQGKPECLIRACSNSDWGFVYRSTTYRWKD